MKIVSYHSLFCYSFCLLLVIFLGCKSTPKPKPFKIVLEAHEQLKNMSVTVDIVGLRASEKAFFESYPVNDYWQVNNTVRRDAARRKTFNLGLGGEQTAELQMDEWAPAIKSGQLTHVAVIADLPGVDGAGANDPRRLILPLNIKQWQKTVKEKGSPLPVIRIHVLESRLNLESLQRP